MARPRGKGKPRVQRRKRFGKRRQATTNVNRSLNPIPSRYICKMKYAETITTTSPGGQYILNLNSLFDPDRTGVGHQPYGFDNLALLYNRYRVISCGWRVQSPATTNGLPFTIACMPSNDLGITWLSMGEMVENPRVKYVVQNPGAAAVVLRGRSYLPALIGRTKAQYMADDDYQAVVTASPNENALLYLQTFLSTSGSPLGPLALNVVLEYTVEFFDVKHVTQS